ncbi:MAG TPA: hypothetical protein DEB30_05625 [Candidatus Peribacter riflensis]|uniref:Uncharacterized protein n=1 Tax=Candidatus Peribacter riflensis TaxID=1735162 RepID=A0A0S1SMF4_9BACT|nr:MAG: hypothetical protein PeribacterA2_0070 [Candidatus Peribacter riflensis]OGJ82734.1 MAG: hypothetical protein A2412_00240 [Candidatus Peribacteria bacterium RIFOXYC1_FULL_58_8]ALM10568.1 MAG: hypothetical protein PeribacterB2_0070 [Candidatus Peribacter riflensis]ALM11670.1 MAG: hypothetical protein PeribacterC2_0069 [Candidatus Peribacter riflensis]ALM12773.1 MAG: hypothetical protein PeribacterD1_0070 [Candidatus Peribacter riflensis]
MNEPLPLTGPQTPAASVPRADGIESDEHFSRWRRPALWVFLIFLGIHLFIFRGVVFAFPDLISGRAVLNTSELVPFFDPSSQFFEQAGGAFSDLTGAYEFRIRYSLLTTWMRYYLILPFAIILVPLLGAFLMCLVASDFLSRLLPSASPRRILYATAMTTLLIHLIILPAKITHFYTLILGFDVFVISLLLFLQALLLEPKRPVLMLFATSLVALANPDVHFQVLYPIVVVFVCTIVAFLLLVTGGRRTSAHPTGTDEHRTLSLRLWKRILIALVFTGIFTTLPYGLFVRFYVLQDIENLGDVVPDTVASIRASSLPLINQMTFDMSSVTDNYLRGGYITATPHFAKLFYFLLALVPFLASITIPAQERSRLRSFLIVIGLLMLFGMWCSIGFADTLLIPTFHIILAALYRQLYLLPDQMAETGMQIITEVIHVLRLPDRFLFIYLATMAVLMPLGLLIVEHHCAQRATQRFRLGKNVGTLICAVVFFLPLFAHWENRSALLTGDFGGFLRPYNVQPLHEIKEALKSLPSGKVVVVPPSEGPWIGRTADGHEYKFIDKFFIYYLDAPSFYFGLTGNSENKYWFFLMLQSLSQNEHWWINVFRNLNIRYLVINKELQATTPGAWYLRSIAQALDGQSRAMPQFFRKVLENEGFVLFEFIDRPQAGAPTMLVDTDWNTFRCLQERILTFTRDYRMVTLSAAKAPSSGATLTVLGNDREKTQLDLFAQENPNHFFRPDQSSFTFNPDHLQSSQYFDMVFPMLNVLTGTVYNIFQVIIAGPFDTLTTSFAGIIKPTMIRFPIVAPKNGTYEILLRSVPTLHRIAIRVDRGPYTSISITPDSSSTYYVAGESAPFGRRLAVDATTLTPETLSPMIPKQVMPAGDEFSYVHLGTMDLLEGKHQLFLTKNDSNPLVIDGVLLLPVQKQTTQPPMRSTVRFLDPATFLQ